MAILFELIYAWCTLTGTDLQEGDYDDDDDDDDVDEESDLYEPPPCDLQSRALPPIRTPHDPQCMYADPTAKGNASCCHKVCQTSSNCTRAPPLPPPDRRMSLPCPALHTVPASIMVPSTGMDDLYVTILDKKDESQDDIAQGSMEASQEGSEDSGVWGKPWYVGDMERREAERALRRINKDGCFLVRLSTAQSRLQPYTLAVLHRDHIYNIPIRSLGSRGYTLGKEGKRHEEVFPSIIHLIEHYQQKQLNLINRQTQGRQCTYLLYPAQLKAN
ncbi:LOW QUALITY PROTEIN: SH2 domain-containing protein 6 [Rhinophrynus dorsalis]